MNHAGTLLNNAFSAALPAPLALAFCLLAGCAVVPSATAPAAEVEAPAAPPTRLVRLEGQQGILLGYYQQVQRMSAGELARERSHLATLVATPAIQLRQAMALGQSRSVADLSRASALLESVLKRTDPGAAVLQPLARLLADQYSERLKLESQLDKLNQQLKESQRRGDELQDKLNALAAIERSLPPPPANGRAGATGAK